jgi:uncharacterized protein (TIGR03083 family)
VVTLPPELSDADVEELVGAYALDACEPDEAMAVEVVLARRPDLAVEAARLSRAAAWIGATEALDPPSSLRAAVVAATRRGRAGARVHTAVGLYRTQSEREDAVRVVAEQRGAPDAITTNGLSARDLVVHEAAQESLLAQAVGRTVLSELQETAIEARTDALVRMLRGRPLADALEVWRHAVDANCAWATDANTPAAGWRGLELDQTDALVVRAFETWIHTDDLRRVVGLPGEPPAPPHLALMSDLAGRSLSMSLGLVGRTRPEKTARLGLTGNGGGSWLAAMDGSGAGAGQPDVTLTADVVDWCLLVGDRIAPADLAHTVEGDAGLAADLLVAGSGVRDALRLSLRLWRARLRCP